ncbi:hypothetical protein HDU98_002890, partial [Podochytrium sp. JEL0797]
HLLELGRAAMQANLLRAKSVNDVISRLLRFLNANPDIVEGSGKWILGSGWDQTLWADAVFPTAADLDANPRLKSIPIALFRIDLHAVWCNSVAIELSKTPKDPSVPTPGGQVLRDPVTGLPTGVFLDDAMFFVMDVIPPMTEVEGLKAIEVASKMMVEKGLTGLHDAGVTLDEVSLFKTAIDKGKFPIRNYAMLLCYPNLCNALPPPLLDGYKNGLLTIRSVKLRLDGALGSWGAAMLEPYSDDSTNTGILKIPEKDLEGIILQIINQSYQVNTHCIGDLANKLVLDALESIAGKHGVGGIEWMRGLRNRIEHSQIVRVSDIGRFGKLGVIPSIQPTHATSDMGYAESRLGKARLEGSYRMKTLLQQMLPLGGGVALGSDFPVENLDPMKGIYAAVARKWENGSSPTGPEAPWYPDERLTRLEALRGFTLDAAFAAFQESKVGSISVGKWADFVVFPEDWVKEEHDGGHIGDADLLTMRPSVTVVGGVARFGKLQSL